MDTLDEISICNILQPPGSCQAIQARAIKFSFPRPRIQGDPGESDMYSGQQYAPLLELPVE